MYFRNAGEKDTPVLESGCPRVGRGLSETSRAAAATFHSLHSTGSVDDWIPFSEPLSLGKRRVSSRPLAVGRHRGPARSSTCNGAAVARWWGIGWTGQWTASVENRGGTVVLQAGMQNLRLACIPVNRFGRRAFCSCAGRATTRREAYNLLACHHVAPCRTARA
jgi:hypothetical protein